MSEPTNPRRPKRGTWAPQPETVALLRVSGNAINGVGEGASRQPSPFFWHPPDLHPWGDLQLLARQNSRKCPGSNEAFQGAYTYFAEAASCGICIADCPWTRPSVRPKLFTTLAGKN